MSTQEVTVTTPFLVPAFESHLLPREVMAAIYIAGLLLLAKSYREHRPASLNPVQCMLDGASGLEVFAIPHASLTASCQGHVEINLSTQALPTFGAGFSAEVTGELGNQNLTISTGTEALSRPGSGPEPKGPINHPVFDFLDRIQSSMGALADQQALHPRPRTVSSAGAVLKLNFSLTVAVDLPSITLGPKTGSPNLELSCDAFQVSINPAVQGTVDLVELMLRRIPNGSTIRDALRRPGNTVRADAVMEVTIGGSGTNSFALERALVIEVGEVEKLEVDLGSASTLFTASCELTANVVARAELELDTWILDAYAAAGASVDTGWQFGGRVRNQPSGTKVWELMHHFQGLVLSGYLEAGLGSRVRTRTTTDPFAESPAAETETVLRRTDTVSSRTDLGRTSFRAEILRPEGGPDDWYEV